MNKLLTVLALMVAIPAAAQDVSPTAPVAPAAPAAAPAPPAAVAVVPVKAPEPLICRSAVETGSLIKQRKTCLTKSQWRYVNDQHESYARKMVEDNAGRPTGN